MRFSWTAAVFLKLSLFASTVFAAENGFDINDVSILFPNDGKHQPVPYFNLAWPSAVDPKLIGKVLAEATEIGIREPQTSSISKPSDWSIRGLRIDPCASPKISQKGSTPCLFEIRLIAQPTARFSPADSAIHLTYVIQNESPKADHPLLQDLVALKIQAEKLSLATTDREPLGIHPLLNKAVAEQNAQVPALFADFLQKHVKQENLSNIAMMGLRQGIPNDWIFFGGDVINKKWKKDAVPNRKHSEDFVELAVLHGAESFKGESIDPLFSLDRFFNSDGEAVESQLAEIGETTFLLENPALSNRNTVDCISCHAATTTRIASEFAFPKHLPGITAEAPSGITAFPALETLPNHPLHWNLRAFGYFGLQPTVSLRTVHESASAAALLNKILAKKGPGLECSQSSQRILQCLIEGSLQPGLKESSQECLKLCEKSRSR